MSQLKLAILNTAIIRILALASAPYRDRLLRLE